MLPQPQQNKSSPQNWIVSVGRVGLLIGILSAVAFYGARFQQQRQIRLAPPKLVDRRPAETGPPPPTILESTSGRSYEAAQSDYGDGPISPPPRALKRRPLALDPWRAPPLPNLSSSWLSSVPSTPTVRLAAEISELTPVQSGDSVWFYGVVKNTGDAPLDHPRINVELWDQGKRTRVGQAHGYTDRFVLPPTEVTSFRVLASKPPPFAEATATADLRLRQHRPEDGKLTLRSQRLTLRQPFVELTGTVANDDNRPLRFAKIIVLARDKAGRPIAQTSTYSTPHTLAPGATAPFSTFFLLRKKPAQLDFDLEGTPITD
jgi:hypothetical protein